MENIIMILKNYMILYVDMLYSFNKFSERNEVYCPLPNSQLALLSLTTNQIYDCIMIYEYTYIYIHIYILSVVCELNLVQSLRDVDGLILLRRQDNVHHLKGNNNEKM